jgi:Domain of unknown function (DUF222)
MSSLPAVPLPGDPWDPGVAGVGWGEGLEREEPTEGELLGLWPDPLAGAPEGDDGWLAGLSVAELEVVAARWAAENGAAGADAVGAGFAAGGPLDVLVPGAVLAGFAADAVDAGLGRLSDDELVGVLCAARRLSSWQAAVEVKAVAELDARRQARAGGRESSRAGEQVSAEVAAALRLSGRSADVLLGFSRGLARLPLVLAALAAGRIDRVRAQVFAGELAALSDLQAAAVVMALLGEAEGLTAGQLRAAVRSLVLWLDPQAAKRRAERGRAGARVEVWPEDSGNASVSGRELPAGEVVAADQRLTAIARALKDAGAAGSLDQLRAAVFVALLTGRDPWALVPGTAAPEGAGLAGSVNLTMPLAAWLGESESPGEAAGLGPLDAATCRDLAGKLATGPGARWCLTLTDPSGRAVAHGCADRPPVRGSAGSGGRPVVRGSPGFGDGWPALAWLESGSCGHGRQGGSYQPGAALRHLVQIRQRACAFPGCRRPAENCDLDHTIPYDQGGRTCECNLAALCRRHHQVKQAPGWHLAQPQPGHLTWTTPSGRTYTTHPHSYPA